MFKIFELNINLYRYACVSQCNIFTFLNYYDSQIFQIIIEHTSVNSHSTSKGSICALAAYWEEFMIEIVMMEDHFIRCESNCNIFVII